MTSTSTAPTTITVKHSEAARLRPFETGDLPAAHALSTAFNWSHRIEDWRFALSLGQGVVAERDGKVLGTALSWRFGNYATIGLVIVAPELQGQRIGNRMMETLLDQLSPRDVLLHATVAGRGLYERLGFVSAGEIDQHQGALVAALPALAGREGDRLRPLEDADVESLIAMDARGAGMPRGELLRSLFAQERTVVLERGGQAAGFAVLRRFGRGHLVGPVSAPDFDAARVLISDCCRHTEGFVRVDVYAMSGLSPWLESLGLQRAGGGTIMVRGRVPGRGPAQGGWALVTQAIG